MSGKNDLKNVFFILIIAGITGLFILEYCWRPVAEPVVIDYQKQVVRNNKEIDIAAGVVPHHLLAEKMIEDFFSYISSKGEPETIVFLAPDHFKTGTIVGNSFITLPLNSHEFYDLKIDEPLIKELSLRHKLIFSNSGISFDHGITNLMPFVKEYFPESKIVPFIIPSNISPEETEQFTIFLNSLAPSKAVVIASVDFSHYLPPSVAQFHDLKSIRTLVNFQREDFKNLEVDSWQALYIARAFAYLRKKEFPKVIGHSNSIDFFANKDIEETTSYFSVVFEEGNLSKIKESEKFKGKTILFVGDIYLGSWVEPLMEKNSVFYPFQKVSHFLRGIDIVFGNLEGPIVEKQKKVPPDSLIFQFSPKIIEGLSFSNFNLLSLANNHTFNRGEEGLEETRKFLRVKNINTIGDPQKCDENSVFQKEGLIIFAFNKINSFDFNDKLYPPCKDEEIISQINFARKKNPNSFIIVSIHWGKEYSPINSDWQEELAHKIIDAGADLIIGHHPHVVQNIEIYKEKLIFYSLGNFIFPQYFSEETQQGLALGLEVYPEKVIYRLFPIQIYLSQPFLMGQKEANEFLEKLAQKSLPQLLDKIKSGIIEIER